MFFIGVCTIVACISSSYEPPSILELSLPIPIDKIYLDFQYSWDVYSSDKRTIKATCNEINETADAKQFRIKCDQKEFNNRIFKKSSCEIEESNALFSNDYMVCDGIWFYSKRPLDFQQFLDDTEIDDLETYYSGIDEGDPVALWKVAMVLYLQIVQPVDVGKTRDDIRKHGNEAAEKAEAAGVVLYNTKGTIGKVPSRLWDWAQKTSSSIHKSFPKFIAEATAVVQNNVVDGENIFSRGADQDIVILSDTHGDYGQVLMTLRKHGLLDQNNRWIGGNKILIQMGDNIDRGSDKGARKIYDLLSELRVEIPKHGGQFHSLIGNHEVQALKWEEYKDVSGVKKYDVEMKEIVADFARNSKAVIKIDDIVFVHAGLLPEDIADQSIAKINERAQNAIEEMISQPGMHTQEMCSNNGGCEKTEWLLQFTGHKQYDTKLKGDQVLCDLVDNTLEKLGLAEHGKIVYGHVDYAQLEKHGKCNGKAIPTDGQLSTGFDGLKANDLERVQNYHKILENNVGNRARIYRKGMLNHKNEGVTVITPEGNVEFRKFAPTEIGKMEKRKLYIYI